MVPLSPLNDPFTTYPMMDRMRTVLSPIVANGAGFTSGDSQPVTS